MRTWDAVHAAANAARCTPSKSVHAAGRAVVHAVLVVGLLVVGGCDDAASPDLEAQLRAVHMSPNAPSLDVRIDDDVLASGLTYRQATAYTTTPTPLVLDVRGTGGGVPLINARVSLEAEQPHTLVVLNRLASLQALLLLDDPTPAAGNARFRIVHAAPALGAVDVYVTAPDAELAGATPALTGVTFLSASTYLTTAAAARRVRATAPGTTTVLLDLNPFTPTAGSVQTLILGEASGGGAPFGALVLADN